MKFLRFILLAGALCAAVAAAAQPVAAERFDRPLGEVLDAVAARFGVQIRCKRFAADTVVAHCADFRLRPYSLDETLDNLRILCVRGNLSSGDALQKLEREHGAIVDELKVYNVSLNEIPVSLPAAKTFRDKGADAIVFCSPSAVEAFAKSAKNLQLSPSAKVPKIVAIGSTTSEALAKFGMRASAVAECADIESALRKALGE